jgi:hypothetical protein
VAKLKAQALAQRLYDLADSIANWDSMEGRIEYHATEEAGVYEVTAAYRTGNRDGQGGTEMIE